MPPSNTLKRLLPPQRQQLRPRLPQQLLQDLLRHRGPVPRRSLARLRRIDVQLLSPAQSITFGYNISAISPKRARPCGTVFFRSRASIALHGKGNAGNGLEYVPSKARERRESRLIDLIGTAHVPTVDSVQFTIVRAQHDPVLLAAADWYA